MAVEVVATPTDRLTGLPLPVMSPLELLEHIDHRQLSRHHSNHPSTAEQLQSVGGQALRNARMQLLPPTQHNYGPKAYHPRYAGPDLPDADDSPAQFSRTMFAIAGYIPPKVIDLSGGAPATRFAKLAEHAALHDTRSDGSYRFFRYGYEAVRDFSIEYASQPEMLDVQPSVLYEFLAAEKGSAQANLGSVLLHRMAQVATSDIATTYKYLHRIGSLNSLTPPEPEALLIRLLSPSSARIKLLPRLVQLAQQKLDQQG